MCAVEGILGSAIIGHAIFVGKVYYSILFIFLSIKPGPKYLVTRWNRVCLKNLIFLRVKVASWPGKVGRYLSS